MVQRCCRLLTDRFQLIKKCLSSDKCTKGQPAHVRNAVRAAFKDTSVVVLLVIFIVTVKMLLVICFHLSDDELENTNASNENDTQTGPE